MSIFLFITANEHERIAFEKKFICREEKYILGKTYYIGEFGYYSAAYVHIEEQGNTSPATTLLVGQLVNELHPVAVVMIGIAFGSNECKQKIGDVLVSDKILPYDSQKILENKTEYKEVPKEVGFQLLNAFREHREWSYTLPDSKQSVVYIGAILTGSRLINNYEYRMQLLNDFSDRKPIGGEMEAQGIYSVSRLHGVAEWIIVKGICDWGYKKNNPNKEKNQETAAHAAVDYCFHVFSRNGVFSSLVSKNQNDKNKEKKTTQINVGTKKDINIIGSIPILTAKMNICVLTSVTQPVDKEKMQNIAKRIIDSLSWVKNFNGTNINYVFGDNDDYATISKYVSESSFLLVLAENITLIPAWAIGIAAYRSIEIFIFLSDTSNSQTMEKVPKLSLRKVSNIYKFACYNLAINDLNKAMQKIYANFTYRENNLYDFWFPADTTEIYVVASPADEKVQDAHLASRNYAFMDNLGDRDAILEIVKFLSRYYPNAHISIMETDKFPSDSLRNNIVVIGGPGGSEYASFDGTVINDEGNKVCKMLTQKFKSHISYTNDCEFMNVDGTAYSAGYDPDGFMNSDYGYFASIVNPINPNNKVILIHGIHTLGVVGAAMAFSTNIKAEMNYRLLHKTITESKVKNIEFEAFFRVDVYNGQAFCPTINQENVFLLNRHTEASG